MGRHANVRRKRPSSRDAFAASRGLLKGKFSTEEFLKLLRQERVREVKKLESLSRSWRTRRRRPVIVKACEQTCRWVPSQWEGVTTDHRPIYARYRHGYLSVRVGRVGRTIDDAIRSGREVVGLAIGDDLDGCMTYAELRRHTRGVIMWREFLKREQRAARVPRPR